VKLKPYSSLTVRGQARRLRQLALNALTHYDLDVARLRLVTNDMNGIFRVDTRDGQKYILRVTMPEGGHNHDHVAAEMDWLAALARDTDLSVPHPLPGIRFQRGMGLLWLRQARAESLRRDCAKSSHGWMGKTSPKTCPNPIYPNWEN